MPAITLITAAPAYAASGGLQVTSSGAYLSPTNPTGVNFELQVVNAGAMAATNVIMTLRVPAAAPHDAAPTYPDLTGWVKSGAPSQTGGAWSQTYVQPMLLVGSSVVTGTIAFNDSNAVPFNRWGGNSFVLDGTVQADNELGVFIGGTVAHAQPSELNVQDRRIERFEHPTAGINVGQNRRYFAAGTIEVDGWTSTGAITATCTMTKNDDGRWSPKPFIELLHPDWQQSNVGDEDTGATWTYTFVTKAAGFSPQGGRNGTTSGNNSPNGVVLFTSPWSPSPLTNDFSVRFRPHAGPLSSSATNPPSANAFTGTLKFSTVSAGQAVATGVLTENITGSVD